MDDKHAVNALSSPPSEVKIRTMRSDIDSMMQSGGGAPSFHAIAVSGLSFNEKGGSSSTSFVQTPMPTAGVIQRPATENQFPQAPAPMQREVLGHEVADAGPGSDLMPKLIVGLVGFVALAIVGYFAYVIFAK